jgi:hypothetical protein
MNSKINTIELKELLEKINTLSEKRIDFYENNDDKVFERSYKKFT